MLKKKAHSALTLCPYGRALTVEVAAVVLAYIGNQARTRSIVKSTQNQWKSLKSGRDMLKQNRICPVRVISLPLGTRY